MATRHRHHLWKSPNLGWTLQWCLAFTNAFTSNLQDGITLAQGCSPHFGSGPSQLAFGMKRECVWERNNIYPLLCCLLSALSHQTPRMALCSIRPHGAFLKLHGRRGAESPCFKLLSYQKTSRVSQAFIANPQSVRLSENALQRDQVLSSTRYTDNPP